MTETAATPDGMLELRAAGGDAGSHAHPPRPLAPYSAAAYDRAAAFFRTAGDPERLRLLAQLAGGEWCVTELADAAGTGLSTVSQRLRVLRAEALVTRRRAGKHVYYSLADRHVARLIDNALAHASEQHDAPGGGDTDGEDPT